MLMSLLLNLPNSLAVIRSHIASGDAQISRHRDFEDVVGTTSSFVTHPPLPALLSSAPTGLVRLLSLLAVPALNPLLALYASVYAPRAPLSHEGLNVG